MIIYLLIAFVLGVFAGLKFDHFCKVRYILSLKKRLDQKDMNLVDAWNVIFDAEGMSRQEEELLTREEILEELYDRR